MIRFGQKLKSCIPKNIRSPKALRQAILELFQAIPLFYQFSAIIGLRRS